MKPIDPLSIAHSLISQLKTGAFLTVQAKDQRNVMTIGWGQIGFIWQKPIFMVPVRNSRHTYSILEAARDFTVTFPGVDMKEALHICGTQSGRDLDKFKACRMNPTKAQRVASPILDVPGIHMECIIRHKAPMDPALLDSSFKDFYPEKDYHTLYFGEILACYETTEA